MGDNDKFALGLLIGFLIGLPLGCILVVTFIKTPPQSMIIERDESGRIREIRYIVGDRGGKK